MLSKKWKREGNGILGTILLNGTDFILAAWTDSVSSYYIYYDFDSYDYISSLLWGIKQKFYTDDAPRAPLIFFVDETFYELMKIWSPLNFFFLPFLPLN